MQWSQAEKIDIYAKAIQGLLTLEQDPEKQLKYVEFVDIYSDFSEEEMKQYQQRYAQEDQNMAGFAERFRNEGMQQGMQQGEATALKKQITLKFGQLPNWAEEQINTASLEQLGNWIERILTAESLEDLLNQ